MTDPPPLNASEWAERLLELLLPPTESGAPKVLACDDGAVQRVAAQVGIDRARAATDFAETVTRRWNLIGDGLRGARRAAIEFERLDRPRGTPPFLPVCMLLVLAASRMNSDSELSATNFYQRLMGDLLGRPAESLILPEASPPLFEALADWMSEDLRGARGQLQLPSAPWPRYVGVPISQCVFRARDRIVLYDFFDARLTEKHKSIDSLALLRRWPGRTQLTKHAARVIDDAGLEPLVRAALDAAHDGWDRTVVEADGHHRWRGILRLRDRPPVALSLRSAATTDIEVGDRVLTPGGEVRLDPHDVLPKLRRGSLAYGSRDRVSISAAGETLIFELDPQVGLVRVTGASGDHVFLLTCDAGLAAGLQEYDAEAEDDLPAGWFLLSRVPREELPIGLTRPKRAERPALELSDGLRVGRLTYLSRGLPSVQAGELDEPLELWFSSEGEPERRWLGTIETGGRVVLTDLGPGTHQISSADGTYTTQLRVEERWTREGWGSIGWDDTAEHKRFGARSGARHQESAIAGAAVAGSLCRWPISRAAREPVTLIDAAGTGRRVFPPLSDRWLDVLGLRADGRWELDPQDAVWLIGTRDAISFRTLSPTRLDDVASQAVRRLPERPIIWAPHGERERARGLLAALRKAASDPKQ